MLQEMFDRILSLRVRDVMTPDPITVPVTASMAEVSQLFATRGLHSTPVVDENGKCVGIITASDFVKRTEIYSHSDGQPHEVVAQEEGLFVEPRSYDNVVECMTQGVQAITPETSMINAARIMTQAHIHVLPVIQDHRPVGILSNLDIVASLVNAFDEARNTL